MSSRSATAAAPAARPITPLEFEKPVAELEKMLAELKTRSEAHDVDLGGEITRLEKKIAEERAELYTKLTPWQRVQIARHPQRPYFLDYAQRLFTDFTELAGDRVYGNDRATVGGLATLDGERVVVIGQQKGRDVKENLLRNFGMSHPEGYRKALRLMQMADKFGLPILCFIDTPGAYPGLASEERHVGEAIAKNLREMFSLRVPIVATVLGEGGSGGALGIGVADRVLLMENAYYSVISPEGCASILWHSAAQAPKAAEAMKISSAELFKMKLVEEVIPEPLGGAHRNWDAAAASLKDAILRHLRQLQKLGVSALQEGRYEKFRQYGAFEERAGKSGK
ncbi:MAG: acetyl-CoA carboxylase carboxyltransferase subunit alpha [Verrucomicrobium sp.]|nr:acetyl-CoA carboxylase carboxyltransferase subunit alpha [Verrucomicrobium sp.]